jgi:hypothetical protein
MSTISGRRVSLLAAAIVAGLQIVGVAQDAQKRVARDGQGSDWVERAFPRGGRIVMDLSAGDYTVRGGAFDSIRVRWEARNSRRNDSVRTDVAVKGADATIRVRGPKNDFHVTMDVPAIADIRMDVSAGEVSLRGIEGNKNVSMWAGEVTMEVGDAQLYRSVDTTVRFGEIQASPFGGSRGGILRSFHWNGSGKYTIVARLFAGEVRLVK